MASRILDKVINDAQTAAVASAPRAGTPRGQVFDAQGNRLATGQYTQKRYDAAGNELPESRGWINIGFTKVMPDAQGNPINRFINLASGIPVDSIPAFKASPTNLLRQEQNHLRAQILDKLETMAPGQEEVIHLEVRIRRVFDQAEIALSSDNLGPGFDLFSPVADDASTYSEVEAE